jgi:hypothetical protein
MTAGIKEEKVDHESWYELVSNAMEAFHPFYWDEMREAIEESGVPERWFALSLARGAEPAPLSVDRLFDMSPYGTREAMASSVEDLARAEWLEGVGEDVYRLTGAGREAVEGIFDAAQRAMSEVQPLGDREMSWLVDLLQRLVAATLTTPEPEKKWAVAYSRWTDPGPGAAFSPRIDQYLTDLLRFRDDAHLAAWKPYGVSGAAWEALTLLWRDEAQTAEELAEKLPYRHLGAEGHATALAELVDRGWAVEQSGTWLLAEEGVRIREEGEAETNRLYFGPWACLNPDELTQLRDLLERMKDRLGEMAGEDGD